MYEALQTFVFERLNAWRKPVRFVQIGTHDGIFGDPIRWFVARHEWTGLLVEPLPHAFEAMRRNYSGYAGLAFANCAVSDREGDRPFFHVEAGAVTKPRDDQLGSLHKDILLRTRLVRDVGSHIVETQVHCVTFQRLMAEHGLDAIDLLVTDTEGHDGTIIRSIDFSRWAPQAIYYETQHLAQDDRGALLVHLQRAGYMHLPLGRNAMSVRPDLLADAEWRILSRVAALAADQNARIEELRLQVRQLSKRRPR